MKSNPNMDFPRSFGVLLYPQFELLDVAGPLEALNCLARTEGFGDMKLSFISETLEAVSIGPVAPDETAKGFIGPQTFTPTHTFDTAPQLDVLIIPGGLGAFDWSTGDTRKSLDVYIDFVRRTYHGDTTPPGRKNPLRYLISVCNGAMILAKAGLLDGHRATTNKYGWKMITEMGPKTHWIARARWVASGNIWTTSGVSAGADGTFAWMATLLPQETVKQVVDNMEWIRAETADNDPFAEVHACEDVLPKTN